MNNIVLLIAVCFLSISLLIETASWWVRSKAPHDMIGLFVSRSNIFLFSARFFTIIFTSIIAYSVETGSSMSEVMQQLAVSFFISSLMHLMFFSKSVLRLYITRYLFFVLRLSTLKYGHKTKMEDISIKIMIYTAFSCIIYTIGATVPLILATALPEFRLSMAGIGQLINAFGTIVILFFVDQNMFKSMDEGTLPISVRAYTIGRIIGFFISSTCLLIMSFLV